MNAPQLALVQLAILLFCSSLLITMRLNAVVILMIIGFALAISLVASVGLLVSTMESRKQCETNILLGIHLGGVICYTVLLNEAFYRFA